MNVKTYRIMTSDEFDRLVKTVYGDQVRYEFIADEEAHNYSSYTYNNITRGETLGNWEAGKLQMLVAGDSKSCSFMARSLIQEFVNTGWLDPGNYMVEVFW